MTEAIRNLFSNIFGDNVILATILIAMLPIIELRGAIPFAMSVDFWGNVALNNMQAFLYAFIGSSVVVPILALLFFPLIKWLKSTKLFHSLGEKIENRVNTKSEKINQEATSNTKSKIWLKVLGLFLFVAIPLPLTGVWTGTCVGVVLGFNFWQTCAIVIGGNLVAGLIITFVCSVFPAFTTIILYIFLACVVALLIYEIIKSIINKKNKVDE